MNKTVHIPVLPEPVIRFLKPGAGKRFIDGTLGGGGHALLILREGGRVLGIDRDPDALTRTRDRLADYVESDQLVTRQGDFADLTELAQAEGFTDVDGILLDLGISSDQLEDSLRGFSFRPDKDGPLLMNMDPKGLSAEAWINTATEQEMTDVFWRLGEERRSRQIARSIVKEVEREPITTTSRLADVIERSVGGRRGARIHPATRVFQAIRMHINRELESLEAVLHKALELLASGGRLVVITFHSLEDRLVKHFLAAHVGREVSLPAGGSRWEGELPRAVWIQKKALGPTDEERASNPRARSAKVRAIEII